MPPHPSSPPADRASAPTVAPWQAWTAVQPPAPYSSTCGGPQPETSGRWWNWCDGGSATNYVQSRSTTIAVQAGRTYTLTFTTQANPGNPLPRSNAYLIFRVAGSARWTGYTQTPPASAVNPQRLTVAPAYTVQTWSVTYTAATTGAIPIQFEWTATAKGSASASTDDIGTSTPTITCA